MYIGSGDKLEKELIQKYNLNYQSVSSGKFRRYRRGWKKEITDIQTNKKNIADAVRFTKGYFQAMRILRKFKPDVVFTKGGYVTVPVGLAASRLKIPLLIHDSDAIFGMSTKVLAPKSKLIATGFPKNVFAESTYIDKIIFTGNPVRKELLSGSLARAQKIFPFKSRKPVVLVFAGSQGANAINEIIFGGLDIILKDYNLIHHTGSGDIEQARVFAHKLPDNLRDSYRPFDFLKSELADALFYADIVIGRAGANSIAEIAAHSKPAILIPSPYSANNHQQRNAEVLERMGAARIIQQEDLSPIRLISEIDKIISDARVKKYLQNSIHELWIADSASRIAHLILRTNKAV